MPPWVAFPSLILLWADVVVSQTHVTGVVGQSVTLPCTYSTARGIAPMCWGRGSCSLFKCSNKLISTDGYHVTFEKDRHYKINGIISRGDLSLTIQNAALSDTGTYCCRIEIKGWFNDYKENIFLEIKPAPTTVPTPPKVFSSAPTTPATTKNLKTAPPKVTSVPTPPKVSTYAPIIPAPTRNLNTATPNVTMIPTSSTGMVSTSDTATPAPTQKFKTAPTTALTPPKVFSSAPTTLATTKKLKTAPLKVTSVPTPPKVSTYAPIIPAPTRNLNTATPNVTMIPTPSISMVSTSDTATPAPMQNFKTAPLKITMDPTSPMVSMSASTKPAGGQQKFKTETTSSSAVQTTETRPITPQETSTTSSLLNSSCQTDGNSTVSQLSDGGWQYNKTHTDLKRNPGLSTNKSLYIGLSIIAMVLLLTILAAIVPTKYLCGKRKVVLQRSEEPQTETSQNETAVRYQAHESIYFKNDLYNVP